MIIKRNGLWLLLLVINAVVISPVFAMSSSEMRQQHHLGANVYWQPVSLPIPSAKGATLSLYASKKWSLGADFSSSTLGFQLFGIDVGEVNERKLTLQARRYFGNSFNLKFGFGKRVTQARAPDNLFSLAIGDSNLTLSEMRANFISFAAGNEWQFGSRYTFIVDWFTLEVPVATSTTQSAAQYGNTPSDQQTIEDIESTLRWYPSGGAFKLQVGVLF